MRNLRLRNVQLRHADGLGGWSDKGPFDVILCAAAPEHVPDILMQQLTPHGRLIMPVGGRQQELVVVTHSYEGPEVLSIEPVKFVPMLAGTER